jgi:hypothetical protein
MACFLKSQTLSCIPIFVHCAYGAGVCYSSPLPHLLDGRVLLGLVRYGVVCELLQALLSSFTHPCLLSHAGLLFDLGITSIPVSLSALCLLVFVLARVFESA